MIPRSLVWFAHKGGVGKSTISSNHAVLCARQGWRTLMVDLDAQDDQRRFLGVEGDTERGSGIVDALAGRGEIEPTFDVRPGLDLVRICESEALELNALVVDYHRRGERDVLERILDPVVDDYDLVLFDLPPSFTQLHALVFEIVHFNVLVTMPKELEIDHIAGAIRLLQRGWFDNPDLEILACVYNQHPTQATAIKTAGDAALSELFAGYVDVLERPVRYSYAGFAEMTRLGLTAVEYKDAAVRRSIQRLQAGLAGGEEATLPPRLASGTKEVAREIVAVIREINQRYTDRLTQWAQREGIMST